MVFIIKNSYLNHKETIHNFTWRFLQIFGKQGITFFIFVLCAKLLSPYDFGVYNYILAVIYLLIIFGDFGISTATSKYVAEYNATDKNKLKLVLFNSLILIVSLGIIVTSVTVLFGSYFLYDKYNYVLYALPMLFLAPISSLYDGIFRGLKRFKELAIIVLSVGLISIIFVYLLVLNYGLIGALISQSLFYLVLVLALFFVYGNLYFQLDRQLMKTILNYSLIIGISSIAYFLYSRVDIIFMGYYGYVEEIGYYELINRVFTLMMMPFVMFGQVIAPNITKYYSMKKYSVVKLKFKKYLTYSIFFSTVIVIATYLLYPVIMASFLNEYYTQDFIIIINILLPLFVIKAVGGGIITQGFTTPTGYAFLNMKILLFTGLLNIILNYIFIHLFGFIGVIYATFVVLLLANTTLIAICWKSYMSK
ncbi:MAG: oligosaccharide flippase family protein [Candidatus Cloacimonetes bacterium]|nr:oligosaccharide flippase family protein [Candidatus Cloacimonadota bacterium]